MSARLFLLLIGVALVIAMLGTLFSGIGEARTDERDDELGASTGVGETETDVVLVGSLYNAAITSVISIISNLESDAPLPDSYISGTRTLTVRGLTADESRILDITYLVEADIWEASSTFLGLMPFFLVVGCLCLLAGIIWSAFSR